MNINDNEVSNGKGLI